MITFTYTPEAGSVTTVSVKGPDFSSDEMVSRRQTIGETMGDAIFVYSLAKEKRELHLKFEMLTMAERADLERFFSDRYVDMAKRWFKVDLPVNKHVILRAGADVGGVAVKAGTTYKAGQYVKIDLVRYHVRLMTPELTFVETHDSHWGLTMTLRILNVLPDNFC